MVTTAMLSCLVMVTAELMRTLLTTGDFGRRAAARQYAVLLILRTQATSFQAISETGLIKLCTSLASIPLAICCRLRA